MTDQDLRAALFPDFVEPADRCDCGCMKRKQYRVQLTIRNVKTDSCEFLIADLALECAEKLKEAMPAGVLKDRV